MPVTTIQELATSILAKAKRTESDRTPGINSFVVFDDRERWAEDLCFAAHGDMLPDDWRYEFIHDALDIISESEDEDDSDDSFNERFNDRYPYTHQQTGWLHSRADRYDYADRWTDEVGTQTGVLGCISGGMYLEAREVFDSVLASLRKRADEVNNEGE